MQAQTIALETAIEEINGIPVVRVAGEVDIVTSADLKHSLNKALDSGSKHLLIDLSNVTYMDSSGFGVLLSIMKRLRPIGGSISLAGCCEMTERMIRLTRLDTIFGLFPTLDAAVETMSEE